jgi:hypothetical protein
MNGTVGHPFLGGGLPVDPAGYGQELVRQNVVRRGQIKMTNQVNKGIGEMTL